MQSTQRAREGAVQPCSGHTRGPDVVIVNAPARPPSQDSIKQVVEMEFAGDPYGPGRREACIRIAGDRSEMAELELDDGDCNLREPEKPKVPVQSKPHASACPQFPADAASGLISQVERSTLMVSPKICGSQPPSKSAFTTAEAVQFVAVYRLTRATVAMN